MFKIVKDDVKYIYIHTERERLGRRERDKREFCLFNFGTLKLGTHFETESAVLQ